MSVIDSKVHHCENRTRLKDLLSQYIPICIDVSTHGTLGRTYEDLSDPHLDHQSYRSAPLVPYQLKQYNKR